MLDIILFVGGTIGGVLLLNRRYPLDGPFEVTNLIGRIIAVSVVAASIVFGLQRLRV